MAQVGILETDSNRRMIEIVYIDNVRHLAHAYELETAHDAARVVANAMPRSATIAASSQNQRGATNL